MLPIPMPAAGPLASGRYLKMSWMVSAMPSRTPSSPRRESTWPRPMVIATAEMKPFRTGVETKSSKKPSLRKPTTIPYTPMLIATADPICWAL